MNSFRWILQISLFTLLVISPFQNCGESDLATDRTPTSDKQNLIEGIELGPTSNVQSVQYGVLHSLTLAKEETDLPVEEAKDEIGTHLTLESQKAAVQCTQYPGCGAGLGDDIVGTCVLSYSCILGIDKETSEDDIHQYLFEAIQNLSEYLDTNTQHPLKHLVTSSEDEVAICDDAQCLRCLKSTTNVLSFSCQLYSQE